MDFFQKLGNTLSNTGKDIAKKTKDMSDISRLNHEVTKQQETIDRTYSQIGKIYFENYSNLDYSDLKELCDSIKECNQKIEGFKTEITQIKENSATTESATNTTTGNIAEAGNINTAENAGNLNVDNNETNNQ